MRKRRLTEVQAKDYLANHDVIMADLAKFAKRLERIGILVYTAVAEGSETVRVEDLKRELIS